MSNDSVRTMLVRKLLTTFTTTTIISFTFALFYLNDSNIGVNYNLGNKLMAWSFFYSMYVGAIILLYGNLVSFVIEYVYKKWTPEGNGLYIFLHGVFGLANGLLFYSWEAALWGMVAALFYALIDRWIYIRISKRKKVKLCFIIPILIYLLSWGGLQLVSPPVPPFTKEDAVEFATGGEGTIIDIFPKEIGKWEGMIDEYKVTRETSVKEIAEEAYVVTFTETWEKGKEKGSRFFSYQVERGILTADGSGGKTPPYSQFKENGI